MDPIVNDDDPYDDCEINTVDKAKAWLEDFLRPGDWLVIAGILKDLHESRYGDMTIVVADGRPSMIRQTRSYKMTH